MLNKYKITIINTDTHTTRHVFKMVENAQQAHRDAYFDSCNTNEEIKSIVIEVGEQQIETYNESHGFISQLF